jgi:very-short-patch-repair endonuclease
MSKPTQEHITKRRPGKTAQARKLRQAETEEEYHLWNELRARRLNCHKFTRQVPLGSYIVDFICREQRLIVEVDGFHHAESQSDVERTKWLNSNCYSVLRFWNHEISSQRTSVIETILAALGGKIAAESNALSFYSPAVLADNKE